MIALLLKLVGLHTWLSLRGEKFEYSSSDSPLTICLSALAPEEGDQRKKRKGGVTLYALSDIIMMEGKTHTPITISFVVVNVFIILSEGPKKRTEDKWLLIYPFYLNYTYEHLLKKP